MVSEKQKNNQVKISIITATFNSSATIATCIASVNAQTHENIEHIIIDGASTDGTVEIVKSFPSVGNFISEPDKGIYDAMNKGIQLSTGDVIGLLHSDDVFYSPEILEKIANLFSQTDIQGVYGNLVIVNAEDNIVRTWQSTPFNRKNVKYGWMPPHPTLFLRKEVYQKHGLFDTSLKIAGDYDYMLRVMLDTEIKLEYLPEVITKMRFGGASTGNIKGIILKMREDIRVLHKNGFRFPMAVLASKNLRKLPQLLHRSSNNFQSDNLLQPANEVSLNK